MKKYLLLFFSFLFLFPSLSFADVNCYSSCDDGGELSVFPDLTVCGQGGAVDFPEIHRPACFSYERPACNEEWPLLCDNQTACEDLGDDYWWILGQCLQLGDSFPPSYEDQLEATNELGARVEVNAAVFLTISRLLYWAFPIGLLLLFIIAVTNILTFIRSIFFKK